MDNRALDKKSLWVRYVGFWSTVGFGLLLFFADAFFLGQPSAYGISDPEATQRLLQHYKWFFVREEVRILGRVLLCFVLMGLFNQWVARRWCLFLGVSPSHWGRVQALVALCCALWIHGWIYAKAMLLYPDVYAEPWYQRGLHAFIHTWTYRVFPSWVDGVFLMGLGLLAMLPLSRSLVRRATWSQQWQKGMYTALLVGVFLWGLGGKVREWTIEPTKPSPVSSSKIQTPSVLLLVVESLRSDRIQPRTMPNLYRLAQQSVYFPKTFVSIPRTLPSWTSLLTGLYPYHHGIRTMFPNPADCAHLPPSLPGFLHGYRTGVWSDTTGDFFHLLPYGFEQRHTPIFKGHKVLEKVARDLHVLVGPYAATPFPEHLLRIVRAPNPFDLVDGLAKHLSQLSQTPFLEAIFLGSPHMPYATPWPYYKRFTHPNYQGPHLFQRDPTGSWSPPQEEREQARALYDNAVFLADAQAERLLEQMKNSGVLEHTIVVVVADHGEILYDQDGMHIGHGEHLRGSHMLQVPLLIYDPIHHFPAHQVDALVRTVDLMPTILELVGRTVPPTDGVSLLPLLRGEKRSLELTAYAETGLWYADEHPEAQRGERLVYPSLGRLLEPSEEDDLYVPARWEDTVVCAKHRALITDQWKLIFKPTPHGVEWQFYDEKKDPQNLHNEAFKALSAMESLRQSLWQVIQQDPVWRRCEEKFPFLKEPKESNYKN